MEEITLLPGGRLERTRWVYDKKTDTGDFVTYDVTAEAARWLFAPVQLARDVVLRDVFLLLAANPVLFEVYHHDWAREITDEALAAPSDSVQESFLDQDIEYVEVYRHWEHDSGKNTLEGTDFLHFHGVGPLLEKDICEHGHVTFKAGTRVNWAISLVSAAKLAALPLRINPLAVVTEGDTSSGQYGNRLNEMNVPGVLLGQLIRAIVWELSFHGPAPAREAFANELGRAVNNLDLKS